MFREELVKEIVILIDKMQQPSSPFKDKFNDSLLNYMRDLIPLSIDELKAYKVVLEMLANKF